MYCDNCRTSTADYHTNCSLCSYDLCLSCCRELRDGHLQGRAKGVAMQYVDYGPKYLHGGKRHINGSKEILLLILHLNGRQRKMGSFHQSAWVINCLRHSSLGLPVFQNLTWLSFGCLGLNWAILAPLLWNAPRLERLTIEEKGFEENKWEFAILKSLLSVPPECLELHMKKIELRLFTGRKDEIKFVEYFLKNGKALQELKYFIVSLVMMQVLRQDCSCCQANQRHAKFCSKRN